MSGYQVSSQEAETSLLDRLLPTRTFRFLAAAMLGVPIAANLLLETPAGEYLTKTIPTPVLAQIALGSLLVFGLTVLAWAEFLLVFHGKKHQTIIQHVKKLP